jgi:hypothetical protein
MQLLIIQPPDSHLHYRIGHQEIMTHGVNTEIKKRQKDETCKALARKQVELDSLEEEEKSRLRIWID